MDQFDRLATPYVLLERLAFGSALQRTREFCLPYTSKCQLALLIGDGDGRFSKELLQSNPTIEIDSLDISGKMLEAAQKRAGKHKDRIKPIRADAREYPFTKHRYDLIVVHYSLDCFTLEESGLIVSRLATALKPKGLIVHSDFNDEKVWQRMIVSNLYRFFRLTTGLKVGRLPPVRWPSKFECVAEISLRSGLIFSKVWQKADED